MTADTSNSTPVSYSNHILTRYQYEWKKIPASTIQDMRVLARTDLIEFIPFFYKKLKLNWFHREIADALNPFVAAIQDQKSPRLILEAPPRHSKSLMTTRCFPAFVLGQHPEWDIIVVSGTQTLADSFGLAIRDILSSPLFKALFPNCRLREDSKSVDTMRTTAGGTLKLVGCEGNIVGSGANLLLCVAKDSLVNTSRGAVPIQDVRVGDLVWTHAGRWKPVTAVRNNGFRDTVNVVAGGRVLRCTPDHLIYTQAGWVEANHLPRFGGVYVEEKRKGVACSSLRTLSKRVHPLRSKKKPSKSVLFSNMPTCFRTRKMAGSKRQMSCLWRPDTKQTRQVVLFDGVQKSTSKTVKCIEKISTKKMPYLRNNVSTYVDRTCVLFSRVQKCGTRKTHGNPKPKSERRVVEKQVSSSIRPVVESFARTRGGLRLLQNRSQVSCSSPRRNENKRYKGKYGSSLSFVSHENPQVKEAGVCEVFDLSVADDHSFAVDGFIAHNCDDVISSAEQADSETRMDKIMEWFNGVAMNRLMPGGGVIVMHTRWNPRDFIGRILETDPVAWTRKSFPALALVDEPNRKKGDALQPEWYSRPLLEKERDRLVRAGQERKWLALFQQQPRNETGGFFTRQDLDKAIVPAKSFPKKEDLTWHIGCDFATSTKSQADKTAIIPVGIDHDGDMWIGSDFVWERMNVDVALDKLFAIIKKYKQYPFSFVAMERGVIQNILRPLITTRQRKTGNYFVIEEITRVDSKHVHAATLQARFRAGAVKLPDTNEVRLDVTTQLLNFEPGATNQEDDWIDALVNLTMSLDKLRSPHKKRPKKKQTAEEQEEETWKNILASGKPPTKNVCPFARLNGDDYQEKRK